MRTAGRHLGRLDLRLLSGAERSRSNRARRPLILPVLRRLLKILNRATHVGFSRRAFPDAGSPPAASTSLRQGFGWQAGALTKAGARRSSEGAKEGAVPPSTNALRLSAPERIPPYATLHRIHQRSPCPHG